MNAMSGVERVGFGCGMLLVNEISMVGLRWSLFS